MPDNKPAPVSNHGPLLKTFGWGIREATTPEHFKECLPVIKQLRPNLTDDVKTLNQMEAMRKEEKWHLLYLWSFADGSLLVVAIVSYRIFTTLYGGVALWINDLGTLEAHRGRGYAGALIDRVLEEARQLGIKRIFVKSDQNPARYGAHRLYIKKGFDIVGHAFEYKLN